MQGWKAPNVDWFIFFARIGAYVTALAVVGLFGWLFYVFYDMIKGAMGG